MKVYIQCGSDGLPENYNSMCAYKGFRDMGFETVLFKGWEVPASAEREDIIVGCVETIRDRLKMLDIPCVEIDYPDELSKYLGRKVWRTKSDILFSDVITGSVRLPLFVKPVLGKAFTGFVAHNSGDLARNFGIATQEIYCSDVVKFLTEWRCFVRYDKILDVRTYKGDWRIHFDVDIIEQAVSTFKSAPAGYAIDFGITATGQTLLVEANDGRALGCYGLYYNDYAKLLAARWAELTGTKDECNF